MKAMAKWKALTRRERWLAVEAAFWLAVARALLWLTPLRRVKRMLNGRAAATAQRARAREIGRAVRRAARHAPWKCECLTQAVAGKMMLARRRIEAAVVIGVHKDEDRVFHSHAWLASGDLTLTGGEGCERFTVIDRF